MEVNAATNQDCEKTEEISGYLDIKVPASSRGRRTLKAWRKRWIDVCKHSEKITLRVYISDSAVSKQEPPLYKKEITPNQAVIFRSQSKTHKYAFTVAEGKEMILHFSAYSETESQTWMANLRNMIWPPSEMLLLEKVLSGVHEVSLIDNEYTQRADLLGSYGYLKVTDRKIILTHPHIGHVIQEWYLNSLCRFQLLPTPQREDCNKIFSIETGSQSSTGKGTIYFYSKHALDILQSIGSIIQQILKKKRDRAKTDTEREQYYKDLKELEVCLKVPEESKSIEEEHYQVPRREIRSVLDIPNFTFDRPLGDSNSELQIRTDKEIKISQRHSCPEMKDYETADKQNRLSLNITEDFTVNPEFTNETGEESSGKSQEEPIYETCDKNNFERDFHNEENADKFHNEQSTSDSQNCNSILSQQELTNQEDNENEVHSIVENEDEKPVIS